MMTTPRARLALLAGLFGLASCGCPCDPDAMARERAGADAVDCGDVHGLLVGSCLADANARGHGAFVHFSDANADTVYLVQRPEQVWIVRAHEDAAGACAHVRVEACAGPGWAYEGTVGCTYDHYALEAECP